MILQYFDKVLKTLTNVDGMAGAASVVDQGIPSQEHNRYENTIGYATGLTGQVTFTQAENVRRFRIRPSATMRYVKDAPALLVETWLETGAAKSVKTSVDAEYRIAYASEWTEWQELSKEPGDSSLARLDFGLDATGTGATVIVEAE